MHNNTWLILLKTLACECHTIGSQGVTCDNLGNCNCLDGYIGAKCLECDIGYYESNSDNITCTGTNLTYLLFAVRIWY